MGELIRPVFRVARNPDPDSTLPFLISIPVSGGPLVLKAKEPWPRVAKVYCHRAEAWPDDARLIEEHPVRTCVRRGVAIDLILDRARENRSQLVFTTVAGGREAIFWQTARTPRKTRPGMRLPTARTVVGPIEIIVDTRERYAWKFTGQQATTTKRSLPAGDYAVEREGVVVAAVERKTLADLAGRIVDGSLLMVLAELAALPRAVVVVEDRWADVFRLKHVAPSMVAEMLAAAQVRYPNVPIVFCESRPLAQEWTYRYFGAALKMADEEGAFE